MAGYALAGRQFAGTVPEFLEIQFVWGDALVGHVHSLVVVSVGEEPKPAKCAGATVKSRICGKYEVAVGGSRNGGGKWLIWASVKVRMVQIRLHQ